jgi:hypothetical protein
MSDNFEMLVDADATLEEAESVSRSVLNRFRELAWISGQASADCVLGGSGYRPSPAIADAYRLQPRQHPFWTLATCGVEPQVGRGFNEWALGPVCEGFTCPSCAAEFDPFDDAFEDGTGTAIGEWIGQSGPALLRCPGCAKSQPITEWQCEPPLGFGNLSFRFWNWPSFDSPFWKIDIIDVVREVTGHAIVRTYGHI